MSVQIPGPIPENSKGEKQASPSQLTPLSENEARAGFPLLAPIDTRRENNFDFLRFLLASLVVVSHSYALSLPDYRRSEPLCIITRGQLDFGSFAVDLFFVISGFLITHSWQRSKGVGDYLKKRALRIYPGFIVVVLLGTFVVGPLGASDLPAYWHTLNLKAVYYLIQFVPPPLPLAPLVFTNQIFPNAINGSLWSIRYEFWCYLMVAALGLVGLLRQRGVILALLLLVFAGYMVQLARNILILGGNEVRLIGAPHLYPRLVTYFLTGMAFYLFRKQIPRSPWLLGLSLVALVSTAIGGSGLEFFFPWCGAYVLFYAAFSDRLSLQRFAKYGDFSYGIYLYAFPIQQLLLHATRGRLAPLAVFALAFPLTCLCAALSWHLVEKPFLRKKRERPAVTIGAAS